MKMSQAEPQPELESELPAAHAAAADVGSATHPDPIAVPQVEIAPPLPALTGSELRAAAAAIMLHLGLLGGLLAERVVHLGGGGTIEAFVSIDILESTSGSRREAGDPDAGRSGRSEPRDGAEAAVLGSTSAAEAGAATERTSAPPPPALPEPEAPDAAAPRAVVAAATDEGAAQDPSSSDPTATAPAAPETASIASAPAVEAGGSLRGTLALEVPGVSVAMTAGVAQDYARSVLEVLARIRPRVSPGSVGRVYYSFAITASGHPVAVFVTRSSGNRSLDAAIVAAVRDLRFPTPPAGLRGNDLLYDHAFELREKP